MEAGFLIARSLQALARCGLVITQLAVRGF